MLDEYEHDWDDELGDDPDDARFLAEAFWTATGSLAFIVLVLVAAAVLALT